MQKILVSIVGAQTLPNILPIKEFGGSINHYVFISTKKVKTELEWIKDVCSIADQNASNIEVDEDDLGQINSKLDEVISLYVQNDEFIINLTGGTKIMALGTFQFFSQPKFSSKMFYLTMGGNTLRQVYPSVEVQFRDTKLAYRLNVEEFLGAYGTRITNKDKIHSMCQTKAYTNNFFQRKWSKEHIIRKLREEKDGIIYDRIDQIYKEELQAFFCNIQFPAQSNDRITREEIQYLIGGWWEEYCYHFVQEKLDIREPYIAKGLINTKTNNELDVVFVKDNVLHVLECKTTILQKEEFEDYVYKLAAIKSNQDGFGIGIKAYLFTNLIKRSNDKTNKIDDTFQRRADAFGVKLVDEKIFKEKGFILQ